LTFEQSVDRIVRVTIALAEFWRKSHGWASKDAADMMASARLDRQVSFAHTLRRYATPFPPEEAEAMLILGYVTIRSLCESTLKLFCAVWWDSYRKEDSVPKHSSGVAKQPNAVKFDFLITFFSGKIDASYQIFLTRIRDRGNAIHHFTDKNIGTQEDLIGDICVYLTFLLAVNGRLPYPDEVYDPGRA
jgi:hypothetical protein